MTQQEYNSEIEFIFNRFPSYQTVGKVAYKPGIETMEALDGMLGHPHRRFRSIHVAGTNGKGSTSHMLAAALQKNYKVGLYTSPHLVDFRERIKVNGEMVPQEFVYGFLKEYKERFVELGASFFEITTALAFAYFAEQGVDVAVVECGLGGRLDSTNIITPVLSVITNIGLDHCEHLGFTLDEIAREKAGIIKPGVPVVVSEKGCPQVEEVFMGKTAAVGAPAYFAEEVISGSVVCGAAEVQDDAVQSGEGLVQLQGGEAGRLSGRLYRELLGADMDLKGACQEKNIKGVCTALEVLAGLGFEVEGVVGNICRAAGITGLRGRWETLCTAPLVICDTGHNAHGFCLLGPQISAKAQQHRERHPNGKFIMVFGVVADKDLDSIEDYLPREAYYYFVKACGSRALPARILAGKMLGYGFRGEAVDEGIEEFLQRLVPSGGASSVLAGMEDFIFIGGSTFVVAEAIKGHARIKHNHF